MLKFLTIRILANILKKYSHPLNYLFIIILLLIYHNLRFMQIKLQNQNFSLKFLTPLVLVVCYWFYLSICFGYFLSKFFFNFFDEINKTDLSKSIQFRKKFSLKNIIKIIIHFFRKLIKNWFIRIGDKFLFLIAAINKVIKALKIFRKKFKSILKFKHNFRLLKNLLLIVNTYSFGTNEDIH
jgi:hypothetical protein